MKFFICIIMLLAVLSAMSAVSAYEVYHWIDDQGVAHYSQDAPPDHVPGVVRLQLEDTTPVDYDPAEDRYGVEQQAARMAELRESMDERRDEARQRRQSAPPAVVIYQEPYPYYSNRLWLPPLYPWPPPPPSRPPIAVPYRTATLAPPGR